MKEHLENFCSLTEIDCLYKPYGCNTRILKNKEDEHLSSNANQHFKMANDFIQNLTEQAQESQKKRRRNTTE